MEGPSPIVHNLLFEEATPSHPARISFTYYVDGTPTEMCITPDMVRTGQVRVQGLDDDVETFFVNCQWTTLHLDEQNRSLFRQWAHRQGIHLGSQLMGK